MHWDDLKYLIALERHRSLKNTARVLKADPTTVSRHIKRLNKTTGSTLVALAKDGGWRLTSTGKMFAAVARNFESSIEELSGKSSRHYGEVKISAEDFLVQEFLSSKLVDVTRELGDMPIELNSDNKAVSLAYGDADIAIRLDRPKDGRLVVSRIGTVRYAAFQPKTASNYGWVGLAKRFDNSPEMQLGFKAFQEEPLIRLDGFQAILHASQASGLPCIGPVSVMCSMDMLDRAGCVEREVWSVIHENRRHDTSLAIVRKWAKKCFDSKYS